MPFAPEHKERTRARIVECARRMFNRHGFETISIDQIMATAGLTRGGFYNHFASKEELYSEAITSFAGCKTMEIDSAAGSIALQLVKAYLSRRQLEDVDGQCPLIALPSDAARAGPVVRRTYQTLLMRMVGVFEKEAEPMKGEAREAALAMAALCVGGMVLARTLDDADLAEEIREAALAFALDIFGLDHKAPSARPDHSSSQVDRSIDDGFEPDGQTMARRAEPISGSQMDF